MAVRFHSGYRFGPFLLDLDRLCLQDNGVDVALRPKAFDVLRILVENGNRVVSKDDLVSAVWPNSIVNDDALAQCISDIRKALTDHDERYIRTVPKRGYLFAAPVAPATPVVSMAGDGRKAGMLPRLLLAGFVCGSLVAFAMTGLGGRDANGEHDARENRLTIAIHPFTNLGNPPNDGLLADAITDDVTVALSRFRDLTVVRLDTTYRRVRRSSLQSSDSQPDYVLLGTVRRNGDSLRITAELVDARNGASRWAERFDQRLTKISSTQDEISDRIAAQLVVHAKEATVMRVRGETPASLQAYELVLRGRKAYRTFRADGIKEAKALAEQAIALDPVYPEAWEVLAATLLQLYLGAAGELRGDPAVLAEARAAAENATSLDGNFATAHAMLAAILLHAREFEGSLNAAEKAVRLNPNDAVAHGVRGNVLTFLGRPQEAIESWTMAETMDPFLPPLNLALTAMAHVMSGDYERALIPARSCAQRAPTLPACLLYLAIAASELGLHDEAKGVRAQILENNPRFAIDRHLSMLPFRHESDAMKLAQLMRRAGLPE
jgi:adenylate cyclase